MRQRQQGQARSARVRIQDGQGRVVNVFQLAPGSSVIIGRGLHSDVALPSKDASMMHLRVDWRSADDSVTVVDLGSASGTYLNGARLQANTPYAWDTTESLRIAEYELKLVVSPPLPSNTSPPSAPAYDGASAAQTTAAPAASAASAASAAPVKRVGLAALAGLLALAALAALIYSFVGRPAEIVSLALVGDAQPAVQFKVNQARRVALLVNGQPIPPARLAFNAQTGEGLYIPGPGEADFELIAYNAFDQPTRSRLSFPLAAAPTVTPTPRPTLTPQPNAIAFAEFSFNGVNKAEDLSDLVVNRGEPLDIRWEVLNADGVELQPAGTFKAKDAIRVAPSETTVYTLVARNATGEARRSVKVVIVDAQATAAAFATAEAAAQATRDAEALAQRQAAAAATAASQATATAIAEALAQAQAAASAKATQDAQAVFEATATAIANATVQAQATALAQATLDAQASTRATAAAVAQATASALEARYSQYNGVWVNDDPTTSGVTRLVIGNVGSAITVRAFARCQPQDCDWGVRNRPFTGEPFTIAFEFGDGITRQLTLAREGDRLRVTDADSRGPIRTYTFSPLTSNSIASPVYCV